MATLISPRDRNAPYFDGKPRHLLDFFEEYELISAAVAALSAKDKVSLVLNYVNRRDSELRRERRLRLERLRERLF